MCVHTCGPTIFLRSLIFTIQRSTDLGPVLYFFQFDSLGASLKVHVEEIHASLLQKALHVPQPSLPYFHDTIGCF